MSRNILTDTFLYSNPDEDNNVVNNEGVSSRQPSHEPIPVDTISFLYGKGHAFDSFQQAQQLLTRAANVQKFVLRSRGSQKCRAKGKEGLRYAFNFKHLCFRCFRSCRCIRKQ